MDPVVEIPILNLEDAVSGGNETISNDSVMNNRIILMECPKRAAENNSGRWEDVVENHGDHANLFGAEKDGKILHEYIKSETDLERKEQNEAGFSMDGFESCENIKIESLESESSSSLERDIKTRRREKEMLRERHQTEKKENFASMENLGSSPSTRTSSRCLSRKKKIQEDYRKFPTNNYRSGKAKEISTKSLSELEKQNSNLREALKSVQTTRTAEKRRFHEILFGIDRALSSLPVRLEKIRLRNQKNLSIIKSGRFQYGDPIDNLDDQIQTRKFLSSFTTSESTVTSPSKESNCCLSLRMKCLLQKMDQVNDLIKSIKRGDPSPIELLVNSELYAISLLKKEIKCTKKKIEDNKTDTETISSGDGMNGSNLNAKDSPTKAQKVVSSELNKVSNFKIFENHIMLQEEAMKLLTNKIRETEEALMKEVEASENLKKENETMAKEILRLKSLEDAVGNKAQKLEKVDEVYGNRPYKIIRELKMKLEEKEKCLISWKSKCARIEAANSNKNVLIEKEKKKNQELEIAIKSLKSRNKSMSSHQGSLLCVNEQMKQQIDILRHQVEILAKESIENQYETDAKKTEIDERIIELMETLRVQEAKMNSVEKEAESKINDLKNANKIELDKINFKLLVSEQKNEEYFKMLKKFLSLIYTSKAEREVKFTNNPSYDRIKEILNISSSELEILLSVTAKNSTKRELGSMIEEFRSIVNHENENFSTTLSTYLFNIINEKLLNEYPNRKC